MAAPPAPPRRPELRHSPAQAPSPLPASPSLPPRARGVRDPLRRSPRGHRFAPALSPHAPTCGCLRPLPSSPPGSEALNIPAAAPPVSRSGAASSSAALPAFSPPRPPRSASCFLHTHLEMRMEKKGDRGVIAAIPAPFGIPTYQRGRTTRRSPVLTPPPPPRAVTWLLPPCRDARTPPPHQPCRDSAPRTCRVPRPAVSYRGCGQRGARLSLDSPCPREAARCRRCPRCAGAPRVRSGGSGGEGAAGAGMELGWRRDGGANLPPPQAPRPPFSPPPSGPPPAACVYLKFEFYLRNMSWNADMEGGRARTRPALRGDTAGTPRTHPPSASPPRTPRPAPPAPVPPVTYLRHWLSFSSFSSSSSSPPRGKVPPAAPSAGRTPRSRRAETGAAGAGGSGGTTAYPAASPGSPTASLPSSPRCCFVISCPSCDTRRPLYGNLKGTSTSAAGPAGTPGGLRAPAVPACPPCAPRLPSPGGCALRSYALCLKLMLVPVSLGRGPELPGHPGPILQ
ncbi:basic proline-rich protein-like [Pseudopipra pipra]|uniref:basic proline-rich protein-like n=1 Tax=Pseudopipra pipra TaxID=415032 RepID=UPI003138EBAA